MAKIEWQKVRTLYERIEIISNKLDNILNEGKTIEYVIKSCLEEAVRDVLNNLDFTINWRYKDLQQFQMEDGRRIIHSIGNQGSMSDVYMIFGGEDIIKALGRGTKITNHKQCSVSLKFLMDRYNINLNKEIRPNEHKFADRINFEMDAEIAIAKKFSNILAKSNIITMHELKPKMVKWGSKMIDLHGYHIHEAWRIFKTEIDNAYYRNMKYMIVVTGQGAI